MTHEIKELLTKIENLMENLPYLKCTDKRTRVKEEVNKLIEEHRDLISKREDNYREITVTKQDCSGATGLTFWLRQNGLEGYFPEDGDSITVNVSEDIGIEHFSVKEK